MECREGHELLALLVWREARGEPDEGIAAVAHSVINRVARPSWWGRTLVDVIGKKWQYSSLTDPHDPQLTKWPQSADASWQRCRRLVDAVLLGAIQNPAPGADSYYDISIPPPKWAVGVEPVARIGRIVFHNLDHDTEV